MIKKKKIGVVRGLLPRLTQAEFASSFRRLKPVFITGEASLEVIDYCRQAKLEQRDLAIKPLGGLDPIELIQGRRTHRSWVGLKNLEEACQDIDVLETHELYNLYSGQAARAARKRKIPLICNVWTSFSKHPAYFLPPYSWSAGLVRKQAAFFIAKSQRAGQGLKELGIPQQKIKIIYPGVNLKRFFPAREKKKKNKLRVLFVGRLKPAKGVEILLQIWPRIWGKKPGTELWLVGQGPLFSQAKKTRGVKVFGRLSHLEIPKLYRRADIFVSPSLDRYWGPILLGEEFFSYSLMEALASGLPIIASRCGGIPEEIGKKNWLISQNDSQALLGAILAALEDKERREKLARTNRQRAKRLFDLKKQTVRLEKEIFKIL
jgi:colanic acid/amylovoran biosynthesis glycosyltransferase